MESIVIRDDVYNPDKMTLTVVAGNRVRFVIDEEDPEEHAVVFANSRKVRQIRDFLNEFLGREEKLQVLRAQVAELQRQLDE